MGVSHHCHRLFQVSVKSNLAVICTTYNWKRGELNQKIRKIFIHRMINKNWE